MEELYAILLSVGEEGFNTPADHDIAFEALRSLYGMVLSHIRKFIFTRVLTYNQLQISANRENEEFK